MKQRAILVAGGLATAALLGSLQPLDRVFVWNATASVPTGLYFLHGSEELRIGDRIAIDPPSALRAYLARRGYLPADLPLLKEVAALPGDTVCRAGLVVTIDGQVAGRARAFDTRARPLPSWQGCRSLAADEIFVMNRRAPDSVDGRYFGPLPRSAIIGRAQPLWTDEAASGAHVWFARLRQFPTVIYHEGDTP